MNLMKSINDVIAYHKVCFNLFYTPKHMISMRIDSLSSPERNDEANQQVDLAFGTAMSLLRLACA